MSFQLEVPFQCHLLVPLISFDKPNGSFQNNNDDKKGLAHSTPLVLLCSANSALQVKKLTKCSATQNQERLRYLQADNKPEK